MTGRPEPRLWVRRAIGASGWGQIGGRGRRSSDGRPRQAGWMSDRRTLQRSDADHLNAWCSMGPAVHRSASDGPATGWRAPVGAPRPRAAASPPPAGAPTTRPTRGARPAAARGSRGPRPRGRRWAVWAAVPTGFVGTAMSRPFERVPLRWSSRKTARTRMASRAARRAVRDVRILSIGEPIPEAP